jgi:hypothetical protein
MQSAGGGALLTYSNSQISANRGNGAFAGAGSLH